MVRVSVFVSCVVAAFAAVAEQQAPTVHQIHVIGDSTAAAYPAERHPLTGWAQVLQDYVDPQRAVVVDAARSGRSSKSFIEEGHWQKVIDTVREGDVVLIQFGHNDSKKDDPKRFADPQTTYKDFLRRYINETRAKGATPVLVTSINRNAWEEGKKENLKDTLEGYPPAMRELAREMDVPLLDLHKLTRRLYEKLGREKTTAMFMNLAPGEWPNYPDGLKDNTHLQETGGRQIAKVAAKAIEHSRLPIRRAIRTHGCTTCKSSR